MQPIDYGAMGGRPDPIGAATGNLLQALQIRQQRQLLKAKIAEAEREEEESKAFRAETEQVITSPSPEGFRALMLRYPSQREALKTAWDQYSEGQKTRNTEAAASVYGALSNGRNDLALSRLKQRRAALIEGGETTDETDALIEMIESDDPAQINRAKGLAGFVLATATGPDKIGPTLESLDKIGGRRTTVIDGILTDADTGEPIAQSPYGKVYQGPRGGFSQQGPAPGIPVIGGGMSEGGALPGGTSLSADTVWRAAVQQESGGRPGIEGPQTKYGRAQGLSQMLPGTAKEMAGKLGMPWRPELMRGTSDEAATYQERLGRAYFDEGLQKYGGDAEKALMYYHGGPDEEKWGAKTRTHAKAVLARLGVPVTVRSKQEYEKLPSGAQYIAPDGLLRVKS